MGRRLRGWDDAGKFWAYATSNIEIPDLGEFLTLKHSWKIAFLSGFRAAHKFGDIFCWDMEYKGERFFFEDPITLQDVKECIIVEKKRKLKSWEEET